MKLDVSAKTFQLYSNEKKKKYIAKLIIKESQAKPVNDNLAPIAFVMAGLPGAGKTEFLDTLAELIEADTFQKFVRIDLDQIVTVYPEYTPKDYYKFRSRGNVVLARCVDEARRGRYNVMIDGTFSGKSGATVNTIGKLLDSGYSVHLIYLYDNADTAWYYTQMREKETDRGVSRDGFEAACKNIVVNLKEAKNKYKSQDKFEIVAVVQKKIRSRDYIITTDNDRVDNIIDKPYNLSKRKDTQ